MTCAFVTVALYFFEFGATVPCRIAIDSTGHSKGGNNARVELAGEAYFPINSHLVSQQAAEVGARNAPNAFVLRGPAEIKSGLPVNPSQIGTDDDAEDYSMSDNVIAHATAWLIRHGQIDYKPGHVVT